MNDESKYVIGVDYGTDSCRVLIVDAFNGKEMATSVKYYPRWANGKFCQPALNQYRQHPSDYTDTLEWAIKDALSHSQPNTAENIIGIAFDTTGSTPVLTDKEGVPLALLPHFAENPNAMFMLWKDHTAVKEAAEINELAKKWHTDYTAFEGGIYSSEWVWAKVLHLLRADEKVRDAAYSWVEHCDWISGLLAGKTNPETMFRSRCAAGHKAMWHPNWGGLPSEEFLYELDPLLSEFRTRLYSETYTSDTVVGRVTDEWAKKLGLTANVVVAVGAFDCHMGAVGAQVASGVLVKTIGTSTCDIMVATYDEIGNKLIPGICGQVDGSVIPGMVGLEAGQSAFGDIFAWFKELMQWSIKNVIQKSDLLDEITKQKLIENSVAEILPSLTKEAEKISVSENPVLATDWFNGRRTPDANQLLTATITGLSLGTHAASIYKSLVE